MVLVKSSCNRGREEEGEEKVIPKHRRWRGMDKDKDRYPHPHNEDGTMDYSGVDCTTYYLLQYLDFRTFRNCFLFAMTFL